VTAVTVRFGESGDSRTLKEREQAEGEYADAKKQGRQARAHAKSPDVFTLQVAGIHPAQDVAVETDYVQLARAEGTGWTLRLPLTTAARYTRGDEAGLATPRAALAILRDPATSGSTSPCATDHQPDAPPQLDGRRRRRARGAGRRRGRAGPRLRARVDAGTARERPGLQVTLHDDAEHLYFLARLAPPRRKATSTGVPREVIVLVDHSGSMEGAKWEAADWAVKKFLSELTERDAFTLGLFHNSTRWLGKVLRRATADAARRREVPGGAPRQRRHRTGRCARTGAGVSAAC
jgi:Ca-activated chloride channel family protein